MNSYKLFQDRWPKRWGSAVAILLLSGIAQTGNASQLFGVSVSASGIANDGCAVNGSYSTSGGGTNNVTSFGTGPSNEGYVNCSTSFTGPTAPGLTSATLQAISQDTTRNDNFGHAGSAIATADLSTASLHGYSFSASNGSFQGTGEGSTDAYMFDELTFSMRGATNSTVTNIPVFLTVDGSGGNGNTMAEQEWSVQLQFGSHQGFATGESGVFWGWDLNLGSTLNPLAPYFTASSGTFSWASDPNAESITWQPPTVNTVNDLQIEGILSLTGPQDVLDLQADLYTKANAGTVDFGDTAAVSFQLPQGVTMTSASGTFGSALATVPEPAAYGLFVAGLALLVPLRRWVKS